MSKNLIVTLLKQSAYDAASPYARMDALCDFVDQLYQAGYSGRTLDETIPETQLLYYLWYYLGQVGNGGLRQYFANSRFDKTYNLLVRDGLALIQAQEHLELFIDAWQTLDALDPSLCTDYLDIFRYDDTRWQHEAFHQQLETLTNRFYELEKASTAILPLINHYIPTIPHLRIVSDAVYEAGLQQLLASVPEEDKKAQAAASEHQTIPRFQAITEALCQKAGLVLLSINALDHGTDMISDEDAAYNAHHGIMYYHITTDQGYCYIIDDQTKAILYHDKKPLAFLNE